VKYQGGFETFKEASRYMFQPDLKDILLVLFGFVASVLVLIVLPYTISKYLASRSARRGFEVVGKQMGLNEEEISLLYKCASTLGDLNKVFHSKYVFERCAGKLVKENSGNIPIVVSVRKKLKFEHLPWFLPLATTRDIELYQTGFISYKGKSYGAAVRVCFKRFFSAKEGDSLLLEFEWKGQLFKNILAEIRYIMGSTDRTCFGLKFLAFKKAYEDTIRKLTVEEQREALRVYKMGK
jgi:hypothetical protein